MRKYRNLFWASVVVGMVLALYWWRIPSRTPLLKGPMVQNVGPDRFTVVWETTRELPTEVHLLEHGASESPSGKELEHRGRRSAVEFAGLKPSTTYRYRLRSGDKVLSENEVRTAPIGSTPFRFVAFGDSGEGNVEQYRVADRIREAKPDLVIHTGDLVYPAGERSDYAVKFYRPNASWIASVPFYPCPGNHDYTTEQSQPMFEEFVLPTNGPAGQTPERFYWFDYGDARFVSIDSNQTQETLGQVVAPWLDQVLASAGDRWKFVYLHHPAYTNGKYAPTYRLHTTILPVMEAHSVHVVFAGHDHMYQRSRPIRDGKVAANGQGIVHIITAAGGAELYERNSAPSELFEVINNEKHSFTMVDVTAEALSIRQIDIDGKTIDESAVARGEVAGATDSESDDKPALDETSTLPETP